MSTDKAGMTAERMEGIRARAEHVAAEWAEDAPVRDLVRRGRGMNAETVIAPLPPSDGRRWDGQCARCGSSVMHQECEHCGGEGVDNHDCGEDCCCCVDPEDNRRCSVCNGVGGWWVCISDEEWCKAHLAPGRENVNAGAVEWFTFEPRPAGSSEESGGTR